MTGGSPRGRIARLVHLVNRLPVAFAYLTAATVASAINSFVIAVTFARVAGSSRLGVYQTALAAAGVVGIVTLSGSAGAAMRAAAQGRLAAWPLFRRRLPYCLAGSVVMATVAAVFLIIGAQMAALTFAAMALTLPLFLGADVYPAHLLGRSQYRTHLTFQLTVQGTTLAGVLAAVIAWPREPWIALLAFTGLTGVLQLHGLKTLRLGAYAATEDFSYARGMSVVALLGAVATRLDILLVGALLGAREAGLVSIARLFPTFLKRIWEIPAPWFLSKMAGAGDAGALALAQRYRFRVAGGLAAVALVGIIAAPSAIQLFFGQEFTAATRLTQLLLASAMLAPFGFLEEVALRARGDVRRIGMVYVVLPITTLLLMPLLVLSLGIEGVGVTAVVTAGVYVILVRYLALLPRIGSATA
jgi:O-antigen/teichoic acid export membrane protein